uniref:Outer membrane lipoprotein carrier protein LolA n=1 Tax=Desulfobacca acetoxidans TaxID=60893 RepID=A0A7C5ENF2_9BACT
MRPIKPIVCAVFPLVLALGYTASPAPTQELPGLEPEKIIARVQEKYDKAGGFKTWFRQETRQKATTQGEQGEGWMYFQKPCRMRWQYEKPPEQKKEVVADGQQVWIYLPDEALAMVYPLSQVIRSDLVMRFFSGIGQVRQDFQISWARLPASGSSYVINLVPKKPQAELTRLLITIHPQTYVVEHLEFTNALGEEIRFAFSQTTLGIKVPPNFFTFVPPPGVQVVKERTGSR